MLTQKDIDNLQLKIQNGEKAIVYYVAHAVEMRERSLDEHHYKSISQFRVLEVELENIQNAYFEYLNYKSNPDKYHIEQEVIYYNPSESYVNYYTVPNTVSKDKEFNPRQPSMIYGIIKETYVDGTLKSTIVDDSPVKVVYTNNLSYGNNTKDETIALFNKGKLDWKYKKLDAPANVDGINFNYITSDWYTFNIVNFPRTELSLINVNDKCAFFMDVCEALSFAEQCIA